MPTCLRLCVSLILFLSLLTSSVTGQSVKGQPAPSLDGGRWILGDPVRAFRPGKIYLVSFWYSPDGERPEVLPLVERLCAAHDKDLIAVCVRADGSADDAFDELARRKEVLPNLRVLSDEPEEVAGPVVRRWLGGALDTASYPVTFLVDKKGAVVFVGDVLEAAELLPSVVRGERSAESVLSEQQQAENDFKKIQAEINALPQQRAAMGDNLGAAQAMDPIIAKYPQAHYRLLFQKFFYLLQAEKYEEAYKVADEVAEACRFDPNALNELAWFMVDEDWIGTRDLDRALKFSQRSNELSGNRIGAYLDTLARVYFEQGDIEKAYGLQKKAVAVAREMEREQLQATLDRYHASIPK